MTRDALAQEYLAEAQRLERLIERAKAHPMPNILEQEKKMQTLRTMRREVYDVYRHLLWLQQPNELRGKGGFDRRSYTRRPDRGSAPKGRRL